MNRYLLIAIGAALGANARYLVGLWAAQRFGVYFPYGTALVNVTGSLILGFLVAWGSARSGLTPELRLLVTVGFLGAYTTFSSFAVETILQGESSHFASGLLNILINNGLGIAAAWAGIALARGITAI